MSQENLERVRPLLAEWERGNFAAGGEILSPEVVLSSFVPGEEMVIVRGFAEIEVFLREFFEQWRSYRIEIDDVTSRGDNAVLAEGRQFGTGKTSGVETVDLLSIVFEFERDRIIAMYWHPNRGEALEAAGLEE
jgi:ketosteroid isomerase-like protein